MRTALTRAYEILGCEFPQTTFEVSEEERFIKVRHKGIEETFNFEPYTERRKIYAIIKKGFIKVIDDAEIEKEKAKQTKLF